MRLYWVEAMLTTNQASESTGPMGLRIQHWPLTVVPLQSPSLEPTHKISATLQCPWTSLLSGAQCWLELIPDLI